MIGTARQIGDQRKAGIDEIEVEGVFVRRWTPVGPRYATQTNRARREKMGPRIHTDEHR